MWNSEINQENRKCQSEFSPGKKVGSRSSSNSESFYDEESEHILGSDDDEQENPKDYCKGGYYPVRINDIFHSRYQIVRKLGWGHFSTVWLCWDLVNEMFVALKIVKSDPRYVETALDEIKLLRHVRECDPSDRFREKIVQLLDNFWISGDNGTHVCMVFEVLGNNLLNLIISSNYKGIPLANVKAIVRQVIEGLDYLHRKCKIIHTDIKPENILIEVDEDYVRKIAYEASQWQKMGIPLPASLVSTEEFLNSNPNAKTFKNKKRMSKKVNEQEELLEMQMPQPELKMEDHENQKADMFLEANFNNDSRYYNGSSDNNCGQTFYVSKTAHIDSQIRSIYPSTNYGSLTPWENMLRTGNIEMPLSISVEDHRNQEADVFFESVNPEENIDNNDSTRKHIFNNNYDQTFDVSEIAHGHSQRTETESNLASHGSLTCDISVKIADLGNACWIDDHFTEDIQSRPYRCLEVLLGADYGPPADIWSTACMAFELATGDCLFEPHSGEDYSRDEDHLAQIIELLGDIPKHIAFSGKYSREFFDKKGELYISTKSKNRGLYNVLTEKYEWDPVEAQAFTDFLIPMLAFDPNERAKASDCLKHPWLD